MNVLCVVIYLGFSIKMQLEMTMGGRSLIKRFFAIFRLFSVEKFKVLVSLAFIRYLLRRYVGTRVYG